MTVTARSAPLPQDAAGDYDVAAVGGSPLAAARRFWPLTVPIAAIGLVAGILFAGTLSTNYTAEAKGAVGGQDITFQTIPGFASASQQVASNYARYVTPAQFAAALKKALGADVNKVTDLAGSVVPESNIVRIIAVATDPEVARKAADTVATTLSAQVSGKSPADQAKDALAEYEKLSADVAAAQTRVDAAKDALSVAVGTAKGTPDTAAVKDARAEYTDASQALQPLQLQLQVTGNLYQQLITSRDVGSDLVLIGTASVTGSDATAKKERYGLAGLAAGMLLALIVATVLNRRRATVVASRRRRATPEPGRL